jgi:hypothetical protein
VDDALVCVKVLKKLQEKYGPEELARLWNCEEAKSCKTSIGIFRDRVALGSV